VSVLVLTRKVCFSAHVWQLGFIQSIVVWLENPYSWLISSPKKSFVVRANSDRERQEWLSHLDRCIRTASASKRRRYGSFHSFELPCAIDRSRSSNVVAAHWIPDDKANICMRCNVLKFSAYHRRHVRCAMMSHRSTSHWSSIVEIVATSFVKDVRRNDFCSYIWTRNQSASAMHAFRN
jgi:hypothetical protein